jgi:hypothetical protein
MTGGGDLTADRTFDVGANPDGSIVVNANDVQVGVLATDAQHGVRGGGTQHALVTTVVAGFMDPADKVKLNAIPVSAGTTEVVDLYLQPECIVDNIATRGQATTFEGGSLVVRRRISFNRVIVRVTAFTSPGELKLLLYQGTAGGSGIASLRATCIATPSGTGRLTVTPSEGTVILDEGLCYVLCGRSSAGGSVSLRTFSIIAVDELTENVDLDIHPASWTTTIAATTTPATFDSRTSPTGEAIPALALDVIPIIRLKTV